MSTAHEDAVWASINATKATYRRLGTSGLRVSVPILGAMSFGSPEWFDWVLPESEALPILKAAYDRGLNTWDTANIYSNGVSEEIIGAALREYHIPREKVVLLTKCYGYVAEQVSVRGSRYPMKESKDYVNRGGLSRTAIFNAVDASLQRLGTTYIDLLQIHRFDEETPIEETMCALHDLVRGGKVRYLGASSMWTYQFAMMQAAAERHGWTKFVSMQNQYNLLYREEEREMNRFCRATGVGIIPWAPLCRGRLARPPSTEPGATLRSAGEKRITGAGDRAIVATGAGEGVDAEIIRRVHELAERKGWKMSQVALTWLATRITSPIVGFSSIERLDEALDARGKELSVEEEKYLEELYVPREVSGHS